MNIGNYKKEAVYFNGVQVGTNESSDNIPMTTGCYGATYDGKTIGSIMLNTAIGQNAPHLNITKITDLEFILDTNGKGNLKQWVTLLTGVLNHLHSLEIGTHDA